LGEDRRRGGNLLECRFRKIFSTYQQLKFGELRFDLLSHLVSAELFKVQIVNQNVLLARRPKVDNLCVSYFTLVRLYFQQMAENTSQKLQGFWWVPHGPKPRDVTLHQRLQERLAPVILFRVLMLHLARSLRSSILTGVSHIDLTVGAFAPEDGFVYTVSSLGCLNSLHNLFSHLLIQILQITTTQ